MKAKKIVERKLRNSIKSATVRSLERRRGLKEETNGVVDEDVALARAIEEGLGSPPLSRSRVISQLESDH